jgi:quercetin dioxygenase-like cupin family protein
MTNIPRRARAAALLALPLIFEVSQLCFGQTATGSLVCRPVTQRTSEQGCYILVNDSIGVLPPGPLFWHIDKFGSRAAADAVKGSRGTVVEAYGAVWLMTIREAGWRASDGERIAQVGPLPTNPTAAYTAVYMETSFPPGPIAAPHTHPGPEAFYLLSGEQCVETPDGKLMTHAGESGVVRGDVPMALTATGTAQRRSLVLILHDSAHRATTPLDSWQPKGLCKAG